MGRRRTKNTDLPKRVYIHHGSYRYVPAHGKAVTLAKVGDYSGMLRKLAEIHQDWSGLRTMNDLFDRYEVEVLPGKALSTQKDQLRSLKNLRKTFGAMLPGDLRQPHAATYRDRRARGSEFREPAPTAANRELELLGHVCTMGVEWGAMESNPLRGLRKNRLKPRRRYVTDEEYLLVRELAPPMIQCVMDLALLTGLRRGDIFKLDRSGIRESGLVSKPTKTEDSTAVELEFAWTPALSAVVKYALSLSPQVRQTIVCNRKGQPYTKNGFDSIWNRLMKKAVDQGMERWQFRDLRKKSSSEEESDAIASQKLGHASEEITRRVYRVLPRKVTPLR